MIVDFHDGVQELIFSGHGNTQVQRLAITARLRHKLHTDYRSELGHANSKDAIQLFNTKMAEVGMVRFSVDAEITAYLKMDITETYPDVFCSLRGSGMGSISAEITGDIEFIEQVQQLFAECFDKPPCLLKVFTHVNPHGGLVWDNKYLVLTDKDKPNDAFYPAFPASVEKYIDSFMASPDIVLILIGPPGMGKSTFLRYLFSKTKQSRLAYNHEITSKPALYSDFFSIDDETILGIEDADNLIKLYDEGNNLMPTFLNDGDGVVRRIGKKIVISTNLPSKNHIDPRLMRGGRCYDVLEFRPLTSEEAANARAAINLPPMDFSSKKAWTLAEVLHDNSGIRQAISRTGARVGF